jgi:hypothetical protein
MTPLFPVDVGCGEESVEEGTSVEESVLLSVFVAVGTPLVIVVYWVRVVVPFSDAVGMSELIVVYAVIVVVPS